MASWSETCPLSETPIKDSASRVAWTCQHFESLERLSLERSENRIPESPADVCQGGQLINFA
jgi:hypothetical protein